MTAADGDGNQHDNESAMPAERADEHVELDHDVIEIDAETWAIHGRIAYDGEVIAAEFASEEEAWAALSGSTPTEPDHTAPPT